MASDAQVPESTSQAALLEAIDAKIGEVRVEAIDLTFGELANLKQNDEIKIDPEYQRLFRWSTKQKSRLVESVLLRLPIPCAFHPFVAQLAGSRHCATNAHMGKNCP